MRFNRLVILGVLVVALSGLVAGATMMPTKAQEAAPMAAPGEQANVGPEALPQAEVTSDLVSSAVVSSTLTAADVALLDQLQAETGGAMTVAYHAHTGKVRFLSTATGFPQAASGGKDAEAAARQFLAAYGGLFGLTDQAQELAVERKQEMQAGHVFLRFQQQEQGIPVMAGELIVQLDGNQAVISVNGEILPSPRITPLPAIEAERRRPAPSPLWPRPITWTRPALLQPRPNCGSTTQFYWGPEGRH